MGANQQILFGVGGYSTWNPNDKDSDVTLSNGNRTASVTAALGSVRGTQGRDISGNYYFEVTIGSATVHLVGVGKSTASLATYPGGDANGWAYYSNDGQKYNNNAGTAYGATYTIGDTVGVQINAGAITFYKNGSSQGSAFTGLSGVFYPMWGPGTSGAGTRTGTLNVGNATFVGSLPASSVRWG